MTFLPIFIHIPKAAGSTLRTVINRQYSKESMYEGYDWRQNLNELQAMSQKDVDKLSIVLGHIPYGIHEFFERPVKYVTMLRNPIDRIISQYYYIKRWKTHYLHEMINEKNISLSDYVSSDLTVELDNGQVRQLASLISLDEVKTPQVGETEFEQAKANLQDFAVVGNIDQFDETLLLLYQNLGWKKHVYYRRANVRNTEKQEISDEENKVREILATRNRYDLELFDYSKIWLENALAQTEIPHKIESFSKQNEFYNWYQQKPHLPFGEPLANTLYRINFSHRS